MWKSTGRVAVLRDATFAIWCAKPATFMTVIGLWTMALLSWRSWIDSQTAVLPHRLQSFFCASQRSCVRIFTQYSPFDLKDQLKARRYRWSDGSDGRPKSGLIEIDETRLADELGYLRAVVCHHSDADPPASYLGDFEQFRS
jgi:hypothetical protein